MTNIHDDQTETDLHQASVSMATKASIATDVSLATARVDTDDDEIHCLDLTVSSRKINSRLFDTKSLTSNGSGTFDQPLDLTCTKSANEHHSSECPSSSQMELSSVNNEFNYVYVYPGLYPPSSGLLSGEDGTHQSPIREDSPIPELISPSQIPCPLPISRAQLSSSIDGMDMGFELPNPLMNPNLAYNAFKKSAAKGLQSPKKISPKPKISPSLLNIKQERPDTPMSYLPQTPKQRNMYGSPGRGKPKNKNPNEIKIISEKTTYPGVYTSVMKLPWSRRTRTKKPKHKVKLEDTLIPQFMLEQNQLEASPERASPVSPTTASPYQSVSWAPDTSQSVMMVYPNATSSAFGKPARKRGRPPKLPMLAKMLQNEQSNKRIKKEKTEADEMQAQLTQQVQANGGMIVYNNGGQLMTAYGGIPVQQPTTPSPVIPTTVTAGQPIQQTQPQPSNQIPDMSQAQFIGQFPLSQITGGQIQFLGQFPASAIPSFQGQQLQAVPTTIPECQSAGIGIPQLIPQTPITVAPESIERQDKNESSPKQEGATPIQYQFAYQPMLIPQQIPAQLLMNPLDATPSDITENGGNLTSPHVLPTTSNQIAGLSTEHMSGRPTHVMKHEDSNTISTMSTTTIANTGSGAIYQEMILSSKSLVDVKKRKRQTAIQELKSKSSKQDFLCTSFRIRPRLVAQAEAQRERLEAKGVGITADFYNNSMITHSKNLSSPQNDWTHFGDKEDGACDVDFTNIQIKQEVDDDELFNVAQYANSLDPSITNIKTETGIENSDGQAVLHHPKSAKRFMLKGSQKRKAKYIRSMVVNEPTYETETPVDSDADSPPLPISPTSNSVSPGLFQELYNCKICNKIIPVQQMEAHSVEHLHKKVTLHCNNCGDEVEEKVENIQDGCPKCATCNEQMVKVEIDSFTKYGHGKIACDECPETFKSLPEFYEHKTEVHKEVNSIQGEFECDFCGKVYQYYHALQFHRRMHRVRRVPCLDKSCDVKFRSRKEMENHFDAKHPDKKEYYHCVYDGCTKKFLKNFHLQEHIRVKHYNIKAFQCPWPGCIKEFAAQRHLKIHLLIHRDEKPMKCDHCDYRCRQRSAMNWHMRKHPDVPYKYKRAVKSPSLSAAEEEYSVDKVELSQVNSCP